MDTPGMTGRRRRPCRPTAPWILLIVVMAGCAVVKPARVLEESTPVDRGLQGAYLGTAAVEPFECRGDAAWGLYAAQRMADYLMENEAFRQVTVGENSSKNAGYIVRGSLEHLFYGGNDEPTTVFLTVRVLSASDSGLRFQKSMKVSSEKDAFHMVWLRGVDVPSPYIEEVLNAVLKVAADDIASRTHSPAIQNP